MKKKLLIASVATLLLPCLAGCKNVDLKSFTFTYNPNNNPCTYQLDFENNTFDYIEKTYTSIGNNKCLIHSIFSNKDKKEFLLDFSRSNVSKLDTVYGNPGQEMNWSLEIKYANGETFTSKAYGYGTLIYDLDNKSQKIFANLSESLYELIGDAIFYTSRKIDVANPHYTKFAYKPYIHDGAHYYTGFDFNLEEANYTWNGKTKKDADLYDLN